MGNRVYIFLAADGFLFFIFGEPTTGAKSPVVKVLLNHSIFLTGWKIFYRQEMKGKVCVVFLFTTCKGHLPRMNGNMHNT